MGAGLGRPGATTTRLHHARDPPAHDRGERPKVHSVAMDMTEGIVTRGTMSIARRPLLTATLSAA